MIPVTVTFPHAKTEFAGSFVSVPHASHTAKMIRTNLRLGITELLDDIGADNGETVVVTLVPKSGIGKVTVTGYKTVKMKQQD